MLLISWIYVDTKFNQPFCSTLIFIENAPIPLDCMGLLSPAALHFYSYKIPNEHRVEWDFFYYYYFGEEEIK